MSGLAISRGRLVTMVQNDGKQWLVAMNAQTGEAVWQTAIAPEYRNPMGNGPRGTPAISGDLAFVFSGEGILAAANFSDGEILWSHNVVQELHGKPAEYGMACSPLVVGDQVIVTAGAPKATTVAYDTKSGKLDWTAGDDVTGYSSPALLDVGGRPQIVVYTGNSVLGLEPKTGTVLWRYPYETNFDCNIVTPIAYNAQVFELHAGVERRARGGLRFDGPRRRRLPPRGRARVDMCIGDSRGRAPRGHRARRQWRLR